MARPHALLIRRASTALTHLHPARKRPNLTVRSGCRVDRVIVRGDRTVGVEVAGTSITASEVIVAAGSPLSPTLLLRSGIGPADELEAIGVRPALDRPGVGRGLYDQPGAVIPALPAPATTFTGHTSADLIARLDAIPGFEADHGFYPSMFIGPPPGGDDPMIALMVGDLNPSSRGTCRLTSPDPDAPPAIDLGFYQQPRDLARIRAAYRHAWSIAHHRELAAHIDSFVMISQQMIDSDARLDEILRGMTVSRLSGLAGAAMGPPTIPPPSSTKNAGYTASTDCGSSTSRSRPSPYEHPPRSTRSPSPPTHQQ